MVDVPVNYLSLSALGPTERKLASHPVDYCFLILTVNYWGIILKCEFWFTGFGKGPAHLHSNMLTCDADSTDQWITLWRAKAQDNQ